MNFYDYLFRITKLKLKGKGIYPDELNNMEIPMIRDPEMLEQLLSTIRNFVKMN